MALVFGVWSLEFGVWGLRFMAMPPQVDCPLLCKDDGEDSLLKNLVDTCGKIEMA